MALVCFLMRKYQNRFTFCSAFSNRHIKACFHVMFVFCITTGFVLRCCCKFIGFPLFGLVQC